MPPSRGKRKKPSSKPRLTITSAGLSRPFLSPVHADFRKFIPTAVRSVPSQIEDRLRRSYIEGPHPEFIPAQCIPLVPHRASLVLEMPLSLSQQRLPPVSEEPCLHFVDNTVFIKHWNHLYKVSSTHPAVQKTFHFDSLLSHLPHNEEIASIAVVTRSANEHTDFAVAEVLFVGGHVPVSIAALAMHGFLSLHYVGSRNVLQFVLHEIKFSRTSRLDNSVIDFLGWMSNSVGVDALMPSPLYDRSWIYDVIRRPIADCQDETWNRYLKHVEDVHSLHVTLRPYQQRAVAWMMSRELRDPTPLFDDEVLWPEASRLSGRCVLCRPCIEIVSRLAMHPSSAQLWFGNDCSLRLATKLGRGGLLCDEMGLGKTVVLMQLVLCNQKPFQNPSVTACDRGVVLDHGRDSVCHVCSQSCGPFSTESCGECARPVHRSCLTNLSFGSRRRMFCPSCSSLMVALSHESTPAACLPEAKATLIVIPSSLLTQWREELAKHVKDSLTVVTFQGLKLSGYIPQKKLLDADVVITTYDALRSDVATVQALRHPRANMRHVRQYHPTPVPLLMIRWHRLALDESQLLGSSSTSACLKMAGFLHATYRWCVTGTPVSNDLGGLAAMLRVIRTPDGEEIDWDNLCRPTAYIEERKWLASTLRKIMWRSIKADVQDGELNIPPQIVEVVHADFGAIESYHYRSLQRELATLKDSVTNAGSVEGVLSADVLTMLRQACSHPQIGSSGRRLMSHAARKFYVAFRKRSEVSSSDDSGKQPTKPMDLKGVLDILISKAQLQCQDALRNCVASVNGLAGIELIKYDISCGDSGDQDNSQLDTGFLVTTVRRYREALALAHDIRGLVEMDDIQKMHIYFNLKNVLQLVDHEMSSISRRPWLSYQIDALKALGRSTREGDLEEQYKILRRRYLSEAQCSLRAATSEFDAVNISLGTDPLLQYEEDSGTTGDQNQEGDGELRNTERETNFELESTNRRRPRTDSIPSKVGMQSDTLQATGVGGHNRRPEPRQPTPWWAVAMDGIIEQGEEEAFLQRAIEVVVSVCRGRRNSRSGTLARRMKSFLSIAVVIDSELRDLQDARRSLNDVLRNLPGSREIDEGDIVQSGSCGVCRDSGRGGPCAHCQAEPLIRNVHERLYFVVEDSAKTHYGTLSSKHTEHPQETRDSAARATGHIDTTRSNGLQLQSELETLLQLLWSALRKQMKNVVKTGEPKRGEEKRLDMAMKSYTKWMKQYERMKQEFAFAKRMFEAQRALLGCMDELRMAESRLRLLRPGELPDDVSEMEHRRCIPKSRVRALEKELVKDRVVAKKVLLDARGRLVYLLSLRGADGEGGAGSKRTCDTSKERCAICFLDFSEVVEVGILQCAHMFCADCTQALINKFSKRKTNIACPTCRQNNSVADIMFTRFGLPSPRKKHRVECGDESGTNETRETDNGEDDKDEIEAVSLPPTEVPLTEMPPVEATSTFYDESASVIGSFGCKATTIVKLLRGIWERDGDSKVVIFSEWNEVLELVHQALRMNMIETVNGSLVTNSVKFGALVQEFRGQKQAGVLLLPLKRAGAGLNLIEVTHVVLCEPSLDVSLETQAIGRVHRVGQTKVTYVHRLVARNTIEERILRLRDQCRDSGAALADDMLTSICKYDTEGVIRN